MAYSQQDWKNDDPETPVSGPRLTHIEEGIAAANAAATAAKSAADEARSAAEVAPAWNDVTGKPATFDPADHQHAIADTTGLQEALDTLGARIAALEPEE